MIDIDPLHYHKKFEPVSLSVTYPIGPKSTQNWPFLWGTARWRQSELLQNLFYRKLDEPRALATEDNVVAWFLKQCKSETKKIELDLVLAGQFN